MNAGKSTSREEERSDGAEGLSEVLGAKVRPSTKDRLKAIAYEESEIDDRLTMSDIARRALRDFLDDYENDVDDSPGLVAVDDGRGADRDDEPEEEQ